MELASTTAQGLPLRRSTRLTEPNHLIGFHSSPPPTLFTTWRYDTKQSLVRSSSEAIRTNETVSTSAGTLGCGKDQNSVLIYHSASTHIIITARQGNLANLVARQRKANQIQKYETVFKSSSRRNWLQRRRYRRYGSPEPFPAVGSGRPVLTRPIVNKAPRVPCEWDPSAMAASKIFLDRCRVLCLYVDAVGCFFFQPSM